MAVRHRGCATRAPSLTEVETAGLWRGGSGRAGGAGPSYPFPGSKVTQASVSSSAPASLRRQSGGFSLRCCLRVGAAISTPGTVRKALAPQGAWPARSALGWKPVFSAYFCGSATPLHALPVAPRPWPAGTRKMGSAPLVARSMKVIAITVVNQGPAPRPSPFGPLPPFAWACLLVTFIAQHSEARSVPSLSSCLPAALPNRPQAFTTQACKSDVLLFDFGKINNTFSSWEISGTCGPPPPPPQTTLLGT